MNFRNTLQHSLDVNYSCGEENYLRLCCVILYCLMFLSSVAYHMENKPIIINGTQWCGGVVVWFSYR